MLLSFAATANKDAPHDPVVCSWIQQTLSASFPCQRLLDQSLLFSVLLSVRLKP
jgi:hypothetical protein